ncbi:hypothetical protein DPMN_157768 [Dreissena polymorpha]|uniref:Uncharacterized protein n=1 Tax=Dreissena polymorpha TaxID=45954 RepID=A0A9D4IP55_DREPO|nr:hypothetical protein DPMN_157768 [Dreissena polymorpha]
MYDKTIVYLLIYSIRFLAFFKYTKIHFNTYYVYFLKGGIDDSQGELADAQYQLREEDESSSSSTHVQCTRKRPRKVSSSYKDACTTTTTSQPGEPLASLRGLSRSTYFLQRK